MADDRAAETDIDAIARLSAELADLRSTLLARVGRSATGTVEPSILPVPKPDTLFLQGQTLNRADYPGLWQWVQDNGLTVGGLFGAGNGTTTFVMPDMRGRVLAGADATRSLGTLFGAQTKPIAVANLPAHDHNVTVNNHGNHSHNGGTAADSPSHTHYSWGNHGSHRPNVYPGVGGAGATWVGDNVANSGDVGWSGNASQPHYHGFTTDGASAGGHTVNETAVGSGTALNVEQSSVAINWLIWT